MPFPGNAAHQPPLDVPAALLIAPSHASGSVHPWGTAMHAGALVGFGPNVAFAAPEAPAFVQPAFLQYGINQVFSLDICMDNLAGTEALKRIFQLTLLFKSFMNKKRRRRHATRPDCAAKYARAKSAIKNQTPSSQSTQIKNGKQ
ncbi:hypothetical protein RHS01_09638 [Rhizoctonia solani]|uniref:Uncharacterized protein n=1 Tax=Rhizoctonia solani TaxID=456999 RepID=A0A8H7M0S3_9AGAM|nr:hypothetical protein RHS01_09638 [Rhizoctonia solani]